MMQMKASLAKQFFQPLKCLHNWYADKDMPHMPLSETVRGRRKFRRKIAKGRKNLSQQMTVSE